MPHCSVKKSLCNGSRIRHTVLQNNLSMLLLFTLVAYSTRVDNFVVAGEVAFNCPEGPGKAKCICSHLKVNCTNVGLTSVPISLSANIESLILRDNSIPSIDSIISQLPSSLMYIDASSNFITSIDWSSLSTLTNLEELYLQMNLMSFVDITYFHGSKLRILNVSGNQLVHFLEEGLDLPLETLYIEKCGLTWFVFGASNSLCKLKILHVGGNFLSSLPANALSCMINLEEIKLNDLQLTALSEDTFSYNKRLRHIDLSNNLLTTLPSNIFDGLDSLRVLNLAGNPWSCDCSLIWLKAFVKSLKACGGTFVNEDTTYCSTENSSSDTLTNLTTAQFFGCESEKKSQRTRRALFSSIVPLTWTTTCLLWQPSLPFTICGPKNAASCVYNFSNNNYSLVQFTGSVTGLMSQTACRDECQENGNSHFIYDSGSSSISCLCGDVVNGTTCAECSNSALTSPNLCNGLHSNVVGARSVMYDVTVSISPTNPQVMSVVNFTLSGGHATYDKFSWNFGDATEKSVLKDKFVSHIYIYPGQFEVAVTLTATSSPGILPMQVTIFLTVSATSDIGTLSCPSHVVSTSDTLDVSAVFTSAWKQKIKWTRQEKLNSQGNFGGECKPQWTQFRGRCIKVSTTTGDVGHGHSACSTEAARLLRFHSVEEISELKSSSVIFPNQTSTIFYTGAEWATSMGSYAWRNTHDKAPVFRETLPDSDKGSCVALTNIGLQGVQCDRQLPYVCEKEPVSCTGSQQADGQMCYVVITQPATWDQAQLECQSAYKNGNLASVFDPAQNAFLSGLLTSQTWIGLRAFTGWDYYTWRDGQALGGYTNWIGRTRTDPCVSMNTTGMWQPEPCSIQNSYVCEYFIGDEVKIPWLVTGLVPIMSDFMVPVTLSPVAPPPSVASSRVTLLIGSWFSTSGRVLRWNVQVENLAVESKLALQIWRPFCTSGSVSQPGCSNSTSPLFTCTKYQNPSCASSTCPDGKYFCLLTQACLLLTKPCTCASVTPVSNIDCNSQTIDFRTLRFQLIHVANVRVAAGTTQAQFEMLDDVMVQEGDVIGFQSERQNIVACEELSASEWRHSVLSASADYWMSTGDTADPQSYQLKHEVLCAINAVYTTQIVALPPSSLNYITNAGVYTFTLVTDSLTPQTCTLTALDSVRGLLWIYPEGRVQVTSGQGPKILNINVQAGVSHALTVKVLRGSNPAVAWFFNNGSAIMSSFSPSCPAAILSPPVTCQFHSSLLSSPYSVLSHTFPAGASLTSVLINVTNEISWEALHVNIYAYALITAVEFYHPDCMNHKVCDVVVEVGKIQEFLLKVPTGDMVEAVFYEDGRIINPTPSNLSVLSIMFQMSATHVLSVNVSNPLSWMVANLTVHVYIRASFQDIAFDQVLDKIAVGAYGTVSASVKVAAGAYIKVLWTFDNDSFQSSLQANMTKLNFSQTYKFSATGNVTVTLHLADMFGHSLSISTVIEVYDNMDMPPVISTSSMYVATSEDFNLTIRAGNSSMADMSNYGLLVFTVDWGEGSQVLAWRDSNPVQELQHQYKVPGNYTISVTVKSDYNIGAIHTGTVHVVAQDAITGLNLTYNGPKHVSENLTFTAAQLSGSDIYYRMDFGDKTVVTSFQIGPEFLYRYAVADVYRVTVTAKNEVSEETYKLTLYAYDENLVKIYGMHTVLAKRCLALGDTVEVSAEVAAESPDKLYYDWRFGDGGMQQGYSLRFTATDFYSIGIYNISLTVKNMSSHMSDTDIKEICVEEEISGLSITYDTPIALKQPGALAHALFQAFVKTGSNLVYTWTVDNRKAIGQSDTLNLTITEARIFTIKVKVQNGVSQEVKTVELKAVEIISGTQIHCLTCFSSVYTKTHADTTLEAGVLSGTLMNYTWDFSNSSGSTMGKLVQHNFIRPGPYSVKLLATNIVSNESVSMIIFAQDEVTGVNVTASSTTVQKHENVTLQAMFTSGTSINFSWTCGSSTSVGNTATLIHSFTSAGHYTCSVVISNAVSSLTSSVKLRVLEQITDLSINHSLKQESVNLYAATALEYRFAPHSNTYFLIDYEWRIQDTGLSLTIFHMPTLNYTFLHVGMYNITLKGKNTFSSKEVSITVEAQERIVGVRISTNKTTNVQAFVGEAISFHAVTASGSSLAYLWTANSIALHSRNDSVIFSFPSAGNFTVQVTVTNNISIATATMQVSVYAKVSKVTIQIKPSIHLPFISRGTSLDLCASATSGSSLTYSWTVVHIPTNLQFTANQVNISFIFNHTGTYKVFLRAENPVSSEDSQLTLIVQGAVTDLKVTLQDSVVATGSNLTFTCEVNLDATDVVYEWHVNGETKQSSSVTKFFPVAGVYNVSITAGNNVSSKYKENIVRVLDRVSNPTILDCQVIRVVQVLTTLNASVDSGTNATFTWHVEFNKQNRTLTGQTVGITFQSEGNYSVVFIASNDINTQATSCQLQAQLPISNVKLVVTEPSLGYIFQNQNITFTAFGQNFRFAVFEWSVTNFSTVSSQSNTYTTSVPDPGNYTLTLDVYNDVNHVRVLLAFTVKPFLCQLPGVSRVGTMARSIQRFQALELEVAVDAKNCTAYIAVHNWTVIKAVDCTGDLNANDKVNIGKPTISSPSIVIAPHTLDVGSYCVHFVTGYQYTSVFMSVFYTVNVTASKLKAVIKGGSTRTMAVGSVISFDGSLSYDPDDIRGSALTYGWYCEELTSGGRCFSNGNNSVSFSYGGFTVGNYIIVLQVDAPGKAPDIAEQTITVLNVHGFLPIASIVCESCLTLGNYRVSSSQHVALSAACENCQEEPTFSWKILQDKTEIHPDSSQTSTGLSRRHLVLNKWGALKNEFNYTFIVRVSCINSTYTGDASLTLLANLPPSGGNCSFFPTVIVPLEEQVNVKCWGWTDKDDPETLLSYQIFVDTHDPLGSQKQTYLLYSGTDDNQSFYLSSSNGESVILRVMVGDKFGGITEGGMSVISFKNITLEGSMTKTDYLMKQTENMLPALARWASPVPLLQYVTALGLQLNAESQKEQEAQTAGKGTRLEQTRAAIRDAATICLSTVVPVSTLEDVQQMAFALRQLTKYSSEYLTEDSQMLMAKALQAMNKVLQQIVIGGISYDDVPLADLLAVFKNLIGAANARIYSTEIIWEMGRTVTIDNFAADFRDLRPEITEIVGGLDFSNVRLNETHRKSVVSAVAPLVEYVLVSTLQTMVVDEKSLDLKTDGLRVKALRSYVKNIELQYSSETAQISIPATVLSSKKNGQDEVFQVIISHERNPFTYGYRTGNWAYVPVQTISFYETNGSYIQVADLPDTGRIGLCLFSSSSNSSSGAGHEFRNQNDSFDEVENLDFKKVTLHPGKSKMWQVPAVNSEGGFGGGVHVQLRISSESNDTENSNSSIAGITAYTGINFIPSSDHYSQKITLTADLMSKGVDHRNYTFFQNLQTTDKLYVVATNEDNHQAVILSVRVHFSFCVYFNTTGQIWSQDGCTAQANSTIFATSCECNHLTSFGGAGIVSITDIDFSDLANLDILANPVVFIAVGIVFVLYLLVAILCRYLDNLDLRRISKIPLCGPNGAFMYEITVVTGSHYKSGTSAHVGIKLYGTLDKGSARHLTKSGAFQRNCRDTFLIASHTNLGEITSVLIWHDNTGLSPSWFLSHILVKDLQTGLMYTFLVNSWLSLEMEGGVIQKTVKASDEEDLKKFYSKFSSVFRGLMADAHTWISVPYKSDHSRFSRVQRATCCLTCVYLYMSVNAMWYGLFKDQTEADTLLTWSSFSWEEIVIVLATTVVVVPFLFGIALIFKKSRCKASIFQEALRPGSAQTLEIDAMLDLSPDQGSYRTVTPLTECIPPLEKESTTDSIKIPVGLKRTVPMHRGKRKGSNDSSIGIRERPPIPNTGGRKDLWNKDTIMQSWPYSMPHWLNQAKAQVRHDVAGPSGVTAPGQSGDGRGTTTKQRGQPKRSNKYVDDSDEDLRQELDQLEAEITKSEERKKKWKAKRLRQASGGDLFDSDDEWVNEGLEDVMAARTLPSNSHKEAEPLPSFGSRRPSRTSFTLPGTTSHRPDFIGEHKRNSSSLYQDRTRPSIVSFSSKSKTTLSGRLRSLSIVSQMSTQRNSRCALPSWCVYVAYTVCVILCVLSIILVLLYGYKFGRNVSLKWVVSLCFTLFISILVVEPLKVLVLAVFARIHAQDKWEENSDMIDIKPKIESNEQIKDVKFRPIGGFALLQAKEEGRKKQKLQVMIREVVMFSFMFAIFLAIVYISYSSGSMYLTSRNIHSKFYAGLNRTNSKMLNITTLKGIPDFWQWTQTVMARSLHFRELNQLENFGYLLGPAWLRQLRGETVTCPAALSTNLLSVPELVARRCVDTGSDGGTQRWTRGPANWTYYSSAQLNKFSKFGQSQIYPGEGYIQELGQKYNDTMSILRHLEAGGWVDRFTRVVFVEFTLYNPSEDLTSCVTLVLEFLVSGGILASSSIWTEQLLRFIPGRVDALMICQIMFFPFVLYLTIMLSLALRSQKLKFFTCMWNWLYLFTDILVWANSGLYIACVIITTEEVQAYLEDLSAPAQLEKAALLHSILRYVQACILFLFSLKIVRQVRFIQPLYKFYTTLSTASTPLLGAFLIFIILLLTYAQLGYLLYGSFVYGYHSFQHSLTSLFSLMGAHVNFWPMFECRRVLTHVFFITFGLFVYGLIIALSVAILSWSFRWSQAQMTYKTSLEARDYEMIEFMIKRFKLLIGVEKQKPAFRQVRFEGLPSLPSRATSSNITHRSCSSPVPSISDCGRGDTTDEYLKRCMANLQPAWDKVEKTVKKLEDLDRQDEEKLQELVNQIMKSSPNDFIIRQPDTKPVVGKPLMDPKARFKSRGVSRDTTHQAGELKTSLSSASTSRSSRTTNDGQQVKNQDTKHGSKHVSIHPQHKKRFVHTSNQIVPVPKF